MSNKIKCRTFEECLHEWLQDPENAHAYLITSIEEYLEDNDVASLIMSFQKMSAAKGYTLKLEKSAEGDREALEKLFKEDAHPSWEKVLEALGYTYRETKSDPMPSF